jgi:hypothetical protein
VLSQRPRQRASTTTPALDGESSSVVPATSRALTTPLTTLEPTTRRHTLMVSGRSLAAAQLVATAHNLPSPTGPRRSRRHRTRSGPWPRRSPSEAPASSQWSKRRLHVPCEKMNAPFSPHAGLPPRRMKDLVLQVNRWCHRQVESRELVILAADLICSSLMPAAHRWRDVEPYASRAITRAPAPGLKRQKAWAHLLIWPARTHLARIEAGRWRRNHPRRCLDCGDPSAI